MSDRVTIDLIVDTTSAEASIDRVMGLADRAVKDWREKRNNIIRGIRQTMGYINSLISSYRTAMSLIGAQIDPFYDALLSIVSSTVSMLLAISAAFIASGVGSAWGSVIAGIAIGLNIVSYVKLVAAKAEIMTNLAGIRERISYIDQRTPIGGSF